MMYSSFFQFWIISSVVPLGWPGHRRSRRYRIGRRRRSTQVADGIGTVGIGGRRYRARVHDSRRNGRRVQIRLIIMMILLRYDGGMAIGIIIVGRRRSRRG